MQKLDFRLIWVASYSIRWSCPTTILRLILRPRVYYKHHVIATLFRLSNFLCNLLPQPDKIHMMLIVTPGIAAMLLIVRKICLSEFSFNAGKEWLNNVGWKPYLCPHTITCLYDMDQGLRPNFGSSLGSARWAIPNGLNSINGEVVVVCQAFAEDDETHSIIRSHLLLLPFKSFLCQSYFNPQHLEKVLGAQDFCVGHLKRK